MPRHPEVAAPSRYLLGPVASRSGRSVVHRGTDRLLDREVAVKVTAPAAGDGGPVREQRCLAAVRHRGVPQLWDREELPDGRSALVLEWVSAGPAGAPGARGRPDGAAGRSAVRAATLVADLSGALLAVHAAGWTHGTVAPEHVLTAPDGRAVLVGFGGARPLDGGPAASAAARRDLDDLRVTLLTLLLDPGTCTGPPGAAPVPGWTELLVAAGRLTGDGGHPALVSLHAAAAAARGRALAW